MNLYFLSLISHLRVYLFLAIRPGFIAGATNPIFEQALCWDILCNIETAKITVNKNIAVPQTPLMFPSPPSMATRAGTMKAEMSVPQDDELARVLNQANYANGQKPGDYSAKSDNADNVFMEEVSHPPRLQKFSLLNACRFWQLFKCTMEKT